MLSDEPFWCEELGKYLKVISIDEADRICKDVQLWWLSPLGWRKDFLPEQYREGVTLPSTTCVEYGIEVDTDKLEYDPPTSPT